MDTQAELPRRTPSATLSFGDFTSDWISSKLADIDQGMIEMMDKNYSRPALRQAAHAANELGYAMHLLGFKKAWKLAIALEHAFQNPFETTAVTEQLIMDAITLRFELPCSTFM